MVSKPNRRTRAGREQEVLDHIKEYGGATVFWLTENQPRACAADRLQRSGRIVRCEGDKFPFCRFTITAQQPPATPRKRARKAKGGSRGSQL